MLQNSRLQLSITLWLAAMAGVAALSLTVLPQLLEQAPHSVPLGAAIAASVFQSGLLITLAVWIGHTLSPPLGLGAPVLAALLAGEDAGPALQELALPAVVTGLVLGGLLIFLGGLAPAQLQALDGTFDIPLIAKLLYGGVTEEVLMRWGLMTLLVWLPWRFQQKRAGPPRAGYFLAAILIAALLFGVGHLPAAAAMGAELSLSVVMYIVLGNALPGIVFGALFWRCGLEAAMLAHAFAHAASSMGSLLLAA